jgi:uncharacterized RDD family membrane protein YckC
LRPADRVPPGIRVPPGFTVTHVVRCTRYFVGIRHDWFLRVMEVTRTGPNTMYHRALTVPLDPAGRIAGALYLDDLVPLLLIGYLMMLEWRIGTTAGKRALGLRVRSLSGEPLELVQTGKRLLRFAPVLPVILFTLPAVGGLFFQYGSYALWICAAVAIVFLIQFCVAAQRSELPWHDRWARTEVVRPAPPAVPEPQDQSDGPTPA